MTKIKLAVGDYAGDIQKRLNYISESDIFSIFPNTFMENHSKYHNFTNFCQVIGCDLTSQADLDRLQSGDFDKSIALHSDFDSWEDMVETAYQRLIDEK